jgi:hypothetical protein
MRAQEILSRGIDLRKNQDKTMSYTGLPDFKEEQPEFVKMEPKGPNSRPRSRASQNNSYT